MSLCINRMLLAGSFLVAMVTSIPLNTLRFECYPNSTMKVENPGNFTYVHAHNSTTICETTWSEDRTSVYINGCKLEAAILVFFSHLGPNLRKVLGGRTRKTFYLSCNDIPLSGVHFTVTNSVQVDVNDLEQTTYIDLGIDINSGIYADPLGTDSLEVVEVGTPLFWLIRAQSVQYTVRPDECWAYSGKIIMDTVPKKKLYQNGCSSDEQLLGQFLKMGSNINGRSAVLHTFRFYGSEYVTFECQVRLCPYNSSTSKPSFCDTNECDTGRRRRDIDQPSNDFEEINVRRTLRVVDHYQSSTQNGTPTRWLLLLPTIMMLLQD